MRYRIASALAAMGVVLALPGSSWGYNRSTHQQITELGYSYLKLVANHCDPQLVGTTEAYNSCVNGCVGGGERGVTTPSALSPETNACLSRCFLDNYLFEDAGCNPLALVMARGILDRTRATEAVSFFQSFSATPCPPLDTENGGAKYHYYGEGQCESPGTNFTTATRQPLVSWIEAARAYDRTPPGYLPIVASLLGATNGVPGTNRSDLTGTILGFHSSLVDKYADLYTAIQLFPIVNDYLKAVAEYSAGSGIAIFGVAALELGALFCGLTCAYTAFTGQCDDCFDAVWDFTKDVFGKIDDTARTIQEYNLLPIADSPTFGDTDNTSQYHFMTPDGDSHHQYDDQDGFNFPDARDSWDGDIVNDLDRVQLDWALVDLQVQYSESRRSLMNYQIVSPDDNMRATDERGVYYWSLYGIADYIFPPVDNLAYYWWHKWLEGRLTGKAETTYGIVPLGGVLHAVQDITSPVHARDNLTDLHKSYEGGIQERFNPSSAVNGAPGPLLIDLSDPAQEALFLDRVGTAMADIFDNVVQLQGGILEIRPLMHYLWSRGVTEPADDAFAREVGLPLAVAASIWVILEGGRADLAPYQARMRLSLAEFERKGPVPPIDGSDSPGSDPPPLGSDIPAGYDVAHPGWACAASSGRSLTAATDYMKRLINGGQALTTFWSELLRCQLEAIGSPVPSQAELDAMAGTKVGHMRAFSRFLQHGSIPQFQQDVACNAASSTVPVAASNRAILQARCSGTLDSDHDGIPDQDDHCITPASLIGRYPIGADGCAFAHESVPQTRIILS